MKKNSVIVFALIVITILWRSLPAQAGSRASSSFTLVKQDENGWEFAYTPQIPVTTVDVDGTAHMFFGDASSGIENEPGKPHLPSEALSLAVPSGSELRAEIINPVYSQIADQMVAPNPSFTLNENKEGVPHYLKERASYSENRFFPAQTLTVTSPYMVRQQRIVTVSIAPYSYNPVSRVLQKLESGTIRLRIVPSPGMTIDRGTGIVQVDPFFENVYKSAVSNYEQGRQWRQPIGANPGDTRLDPTRDWFETGLTYYRVKVAADGWYRVTKADLASAGVNTAQIDLPTLKMFAKGQQVPIMVRPDTTIEFYGIMNHGDSTYYDFFTDTSSYWITWGGSVPGTRFAAATAYQGVAYDSIISTVQSRHFEKNDWYYQGTTTQEIIENDDVPGEGWAWGTQPEWLYAGGPSRTYSFMTDARDSSVTNAALRVRLFGASKDANPVTHRIRFWVNDSLAGEITFPQRTQGLLNTTIPASWLRPDSNILKMTSYITITGVNLVYPDWFEVDYQRKLRAQNNQLLFRSSQPSGGASRHFTVSGFSNPFIDIFDLTGARRVTGGVVSGDSLAGFTISFNDTLSGPKTYLVVASGGPRSVPPLQQKQFADIRVNPAGADYLIVAHRNFRAAAERLRLERQNTNGVRAQIVYVDDIYDEFNYGVMNVWAVKNFIKYAYLNWQVPRLTYVTMFGDACWDYHRYISTTTQESYVPTYGVPSGDNWFGCFNPDTAFIPSVLIGRLPVRDSLEAEQVVSKLSGYDNYSLDEWNKNFMMITGGNDTIEWSQFNALSDLAINNYIHPPPIGGTAFRIYKSTPSVVDGENKQRMRDLIRDGLVYLNFLGHSGGVFWGVDVGDPYTLDNTNGKLPFVSSVSCNVGAFADPYRTMLAEQFLLADNRGAIACWASSGLGYPGQGALMNQYFLQGIASGIRDLGTLTTVARLRMWQSNPGSYVNVAMMKLNPLIGDPLTSFALPQLPDLAVTPGDITVTPAAATPNDSVLTLRASIRNYGIVPTDSVGITLTDMYNGQTVAVMSNRKFPRTLHYDTVSVAWSAVENPGRHTLVLSLDPTGSIPEVNEMNNTASVDQYVYANLLSVVKPFNNMVVAPGVQTLVVTSPLGVDSTGLQYYFELDTVDTFDSPFKVVSPAIAPGAVSGQWTTPPLPDNSVFFWRARTMVGGLEGTWVVSSFSTSSSGLPSPPVFRWREYTRRQFSREQLAQSAATDSGVILSPRPTLHLVAKSYGSRSGPPLYSTITLNEIAVTSYIYIIGTSVLGMRVNDFNNEYALGAGNPYAAWTPDSLLSFIRGTPTGNYLAFISLNNVQPSFNESVYVAFEALGSTRVRQIQPGQAWAFIGRKGYPGAVLESLTNDSSAVSLQIPNYFSIGSGAITTTGIFIPTAWDAFHWRHASSPPSTTTRVALTGIRSNGGVDTLVQVAGDSLDVSLTALGRYTSGPTYVSFKPAAMLTTSDALRTPVLRDWWIDFVPPADLAVSARTVGIQDLTIQKGMQLDLPVTVHNIGFHGVDSARIVVSVFDKFNKARPIASAMVDTIPVNGATSTTIPISTTNFSRRVTLQISVAPSKKYKDLVPENNNAYYSFNVVGGASSGLQLFADGVQLMDGDYVAAQPVLVVRRAHSNEAGREVNNVELFVDGKLLTDPGHGQDGMQRAPAGGSDATFIPRLSSGRHELKARSISIDMTGVIDSSETSLMVTVIDKLQILQLYNYPNPFSNDTYFTFTLTGREAPEELRIRIFTVSGRRIREIVVPRGRIQIGQNRVYWDGRDEDGDDLANGYYFYQVVVKGDGRTETLIQKLARLR